jgi:hypothetical protein
MEKQGGIPTPLSEDEMAELQERAAKVEYPIF